MNLIIPMAGRGTRLRPHTLTTPKPLVPVAGIPIIERLVKDLSEGLDHPFKNIAYIIGDPGDDAIDSLNQIAEDVGAKASYFHQEQPLGPAHAIYSAEECLDGPCMIAFADTLFKAEFKVPADAEGIIWVHRVENPSSYGVVKTKDDGTIEAFIEKPSEFISDMAIVGIYYVKDARLLRDEIKYLIDNDITEKGEYQITTALDNLRSKGLRFRTAEIEQWLDCGNKEALILANKNILEWSGVNEIDRNANVVNSHVIPPCKIGQNVLIENSIVGPFATIGDNVEIKRSIVENSIVQNDSSLFGVNIKKSLIGRFADCSGETSELNLGDYSHIHL